MIAVADPTSPAAHVAGLISPNVTVAMLPALVTTICSAPVHPSASVTSTVYIPALRLLILRVVSPVDQLYENGSTPPVTDTIVAPPLLVSQVLGV